MLDYFNKPTRTRLTVLTILVRTFWCQHSTIIETMRSETWSKRLQSALKRSLATATKGLNWAKWHQGFKQGAPAIDELHAHVSFSVFERALQVLPWFTNIYEWTRPELVCDCGLFEFCNPIQSFIAKAALAMQSIATNDLRSGIHQFALFESICAVQDREEGAMQK